MLLKEFLSQALAENPYDNIEKNYKVGEIYEGQLPK